MKPAIINFLRREAHQFYLGLNPQQRMLTNEKRIYLAMKAAWRQGSTIKKEAREKAGTMPLNFKDLPDEYKEKLQNAASAGHAGLY